MGEERSESAVAKVVAFVVRVKAGSTCAEASESVVCFKDAVSTVSPLNSAQEARFLTMRPRTAVVSRHRMRRCPAVCKSAEIRQQDCASYTSYFISHSCQILVQ